MIVDRIGMTERFKFYKAKYIDNQTNLNSETAPVALVWCEELEDEETQTIQSFGVAQYRHLTTKLRTKTSLDYEVNDIIIFADKKWLIGKIQIIQDSNNRLYSKRAQREYFLTLRSF